MATNRVRELREGLGLSREELARRADVTYAYIRKLEEGEGKRPEHGAITRVATALGVTPAVLLDMPPEESAELPGTEDLPVPIARAIQRLGRYLTPRDWERAVAFLEGLAAARGAPTEATDEPAAFGYQAPDAGEPHQQAQGKQTA